MEDYRKEITDISKEIIDLIVRRDEVSRALGNYKREKEIPIYDPAREQSLLESLADYAASKGIDDPEFVRKVFIPIFERSRKVQGE